MRGAGLFCFFFGHKKERLKMFESKRKYRYQKNHREARALFNFKQIPPLQIHLDAPAEIAANHYHHSSNHVETNLHLYSDP